VTRSVKIVCAKNPPFAEGFEREREELLEGLDKCGVQQQELHRLSWENRKRAEEIRELQKVSAVGEFETFEGESAWLSSTFRVEGPEPVLCVLQALSDAHNFLFEERQRLLALQASHSRA
jgi:coiled-coil domain-containing protein 77